MITRYHEDMDERSTLLDFIAAHPNLPRPVLKCLEARVNLITLGWFAPNPTTHTAAQASAQARAEAIQRNAEFRRWITQPPDIPDDDNGYAGVTFHDLKPDDHE